VGDAGRPRGECLPSGGVSGEPSGIRAYGGRPDFRDTGGDHHHQRSTHSGTGPV